MDNSQFPLNQIPRTQTWFGFVVGGYGFFNVVRYLIYHDIPPLLGRTPMPFSTSVAFFLVGTYMYWNGIWNRGQLGYDMDIKKDVAALKAKRRATLVNPPPLTPPQPAFHVGDLFTPANLPKTVAALGSIATIIITVIAAIKH